jgi:predicted DNA-binding protein
MMGAMKKHPRYHVVSLRISDEEREALELFAQRTSRNVSQLMREAVGLLRRKMETAERP